MFLLKETCETSYQPADETSHIIDCESSVQSPLKNMRYDSAEKLSTTKFSFDKASDSSSGYSAYKDRMNSKNSASEPESALAALDRIEANTLRELEDLGRYPSPSSSSKSTGYTSDISRKLTSSCNVPCDPDIEIIDIKQSDSPFLPSIGRRIKERTFKSVIENTRNYERSSSSTGNCSSMVVESSQPETVEVIDCASIIPKKELDYQVSCSFTNKSNNSSCGVGDVRHTMPDQSDNNPPHLPIIIDDDDTVQSDHPHQPAHSHLHHHRSLETSSHQQESIERIQYGQMIKVKDSRNAESVVSSNADPDHLFSLDSKLHSADRFLSIDAHRGLHKDTNIPVAIEENYVSTSDSSTTLLNNPSYIDISQLSKRKPDFLQQPSPKKVCDETNVSLNIANLPKVMEGTFHIKNPAITPVSGFSQSVSCNVNSDKSSELSLVTKFELKIGMDNKLISKCGQMDGNSMVAIAEEQVAGSTCRMEEMMPLNETCIMPSSVDVRAEADTTVSEYQLSLSKPPTTPTLESSVSQSSNPTDTPDKQSIVGSSSIDNAPMSSFVGGSHSDSVSQAPNLTTLSPSPPVSQQLHVASQGDNSAVQENPNSSTPSHNSSMTEGSTSNTATTTTTDSHGISAAGSSKWNQDLTVEAPLESSQHQQKFTKPDESRANTPSTTSQSKLSAESDETNSNLDNQPHSQHQSLSSSTTSAAIVTATTTTAVPEDAHKDKKEEGSEKESQEQPSTDSSNQHPYQGDKQDDGDMTDPGDSDDGTDIMEPDIKPILQDDVAAGIDSAIDFDAAHMRKMSSETSTGPGDFTSQLEKLHSETEMDVCDRKMVFKGLESTSTDPDTEKFMKVNLLKSPKKEIFDDNDFIPEAKVKVEPNSSDHASMDKVEGTDQDDNLPASQGKRTKYFYLFGNLIFELIFP